jgi:hypothetical protein
MYGDFEDLNIPYTLDASLYRDLNNQALKEYIKRIEKTIYKKGRSNGKNKRGNIKSN